MADVTENDEQLRAVEEQWETEQVLKLAGQVFSAIATGTQTFAHVTGRDEAVEKACKESVRVARSILRYAVQPVVESQALAPVVSIQSTSQRIPTPQSPPATQYTHGQFGGQPAPAMAAQYGNGFPKPAIAPIMPQPRPGGAGT